MSKVHKRSKSSECATGPMGTCKTWGKFCYSDKQHAKRRLRLPGIDRSMHVYRCEDCTFWHIGHMRLSSREAYRPKISS